MKSLSILIGVLVPAACVLAVQNPNVSSPVGSATTPPSANRSGLISRPSPTAYNSNDIVTGNVGGMYHFRGVVPYSSSYYTRSNSYSSVDDFLRRSYDPLNANRSSNPYPTYYDMRRTAVNPSIRADGSGLFSPQITLQGQNDPYIPPMLPQINHTQYSRQRPLSMSASELEQMMARQMEVRRQTDKTRQPIEPTEAINETNADKSLFFQEYLKPFEPSDQTPETPATEQPQPDEQQPQTIENQPKPKPENPRRDPLLQQLLDEAEAKEDLPRELSETDKAQAAALLSKYKTFENLAAARVAEYMAEGEKMLREGRFYKAADMFALANLWDPDAAKPYVGQAFSLFAAGEYMSSAFYLSQAILRNAAVASHPVDLAKLVGDRDVYETRLLEMTTWQQKSGSGELAFMMAYVLYHDGKTDKAAEAIAIAAEKMPEDQAVAALRAVILPSEQKP